MIQIRFYSVRGFVFSATRLFYLLRHRRWLPRPLSHALVVGDHQAAGRAPRRWGFEARRPQGRVDWYTPRWESAPAWMTAPPALTFTLWRDLTDAELDRLIARSERPYPGRQILGAAWQRIGIDLCRADRWLPRRIFKNGWGKGVFVCVEVPLGLDELMDCPLDCDAVFPQELADHLESDPRFQRTG